LEGRSLLRPLPWRLVGADGRDRRLEVGREYIHLQGLNIHAASLRMVNAAHCILDRCSLNCISHFTRIYAAGQVEHGRDTKTPGETGIFISGHDNAFLNSTARSSAGAGLYLNGYRHTVHNCLIDEVDYASHDTRG
jgi:hypothetical protein